MNSLKRFFPLLRVAIIVSLLVVIAALGNYEPFKLKTSGSVPEDPYMREIVPSDKVRMEIVGDGVTPTSVTVAFINNDECIYTYGEEFFLHKLIDGQWYTMSWINDNVDFAAVGYTMEPGRTEKEYSWKFMHGEMAPGQYRIVTSVNPENDSGSNVFLEASFTIE